MLTTAEVIELIDNAHEVNRTLAAFAHREEQDNHDLLKGVGVHLPGWGYGAAKSVAFYLCDHLRQEDTSEVCWCTVAEHLDNTMPLN
jgi:hypothetical protein